MNTRSFRKGCFHQRGWRELRTVIFRQGHFAQIQNGLQGTQGMNIRWITREERVQHRVVSRDSGERIVTDELLQQINGDGVETWGQTIQRLSRVSR